MRAVDLDDTELAMGDDDGWLAVVLGNRLPQPGVRYLACLINLEGQHASLPTVPGAAAGGRLPARRRACWTCAPRPPPPYGDVDASTPP